MSIHSDYKAGKLTDDEYREACARKREGKREYIDDFERFADEEYNDEQVEPDNLKPPVESGGGD